MKSKGRTLRPPTARRKARRWTPDPYSYKVTEATVHVRYSMDVGGAWKTVELGAKAAVSTGMSLEQVEDHLYWRLGKRIKRHFSAAISKRAKGKKRAARPPISL